MSQDNPSVQWSDLEQWIQKFAPRVYFHPDEVFFDEDAWNYVNDTNVGYFTATECTEGKNKGKPSIDPQQEEKNQENLSSSDNTKHNSYLGLIDANPKSSAFSETTSGTSGPFDTSKCYVHVLAINGYIELQYILFSPFNGGTTARFDAGWFGSDATASLGTTGVGSHQGDWEHITVRISMTGEFIAAWYSQHSVGEWCSPETTPFVEGSHPVVYCAKRTHASYPSTGVHTIYKKGPYKTVFDPSKHIPVINVTIGVCDVTKESDDPKYGPWDTWEGDGGDGGDGVLGPNLCVLEVDGLEVDGGTPPAPPGWFDFGGRWGGPFPAKYSFGEIHSIGASLVAAFSKANPIIAAGIFVIVSYILAALASIASGPIGASIAIAFATGGPEGVVGLIFTYVVAIGVVYGLILTVIIDLIARGNTTFGPERVQDKDYWTDGEKIPYSTAPQHMMNGSSDVTMMFSPSLAVTSSITTSISNNYENDQLIAFYCDRSNNLYYETSESFGTKWNARHKATSNNAHSSPAAVFHLNENKGWAQTYVFYQRKNESISYCYSDNPGDTSSWTDGDISCTDNKTMLYNSGLSAAVMDDKMYVVYRDAHDYFVMVSGTIDQESGKGITDWSFVTPNDQTTGQPLDLGVIGSIPYIVTTDDGSLLLSYSINGQPYLRECYWKVVEPDGNGDGDKTTHQLTWGQASALSTDNLMSGSSAQPVIVDDITYLLYGASNPPDGALSNIYYVIATPDNRPEQGTDPRKYTISRSASLGVNMSTDRNLGLAAGIDGSIRLQIRKQGTNLLYFATSYPYTAPD